MLKMLDGTSFSNGVSHIIKVRDNFEDVGIDD
jgi:hypothetical protein